MTDSPNSRFRLPHWGWFLLATVALVIGFVSLSVWLPYHREQQAILRIESCGGEAFEAVTSGPNWLRQLVGIGRMHEFKVFDRVSKASLDIAIVTDADIAYLSRLRNLEYLSFSRTAITDRGLANLSGLTNLKYLSLSESAVTDAGMAHLSELASLRSLYLFNTEVTDGGLPHLRRLSSLRHLGLNGTKVTEMGIEELKKALPQCRISH
jgi:hypothetical protein